MSHWVKVLLVFWQLYSTRLWINLYPKPWQAEHFWPINPIFYVYGSSGPGRGKSWTNVTFFFKSQRLLWTDKSKNSYTFKSFYLILFSAVLKIWVSGFRRNLGCARYAQSWVFFQNFQNTAFLLLYYSASKKATAMVFIWGDRGYPAVRFEYKTASERYLVAEL